MPFLDAKCFACARTHEYCVPLARVDQVEQKVHIFFTFLINAFVFELWSQTSQKFWGSGMSDAILQNIKDWRSSPVLGTVKCNNDWNNENCQVKYKWWSLFFMYHFNCSNGHYSWVYLQQNDILQNESYTSDAVCCSQRMEEGLLDGGFSLFNKRFRGHEQKRFSLSSFHSIAVLSGGLWEIQPRFLSLNRA